MTHWADTMLGKGAPAPAPEPKPPRPPVTTGHKVAAGIILSFFAFVGIAVAVSWNHDPYADTRDPVAEACADAVGIQNTAALARCIQTVDAGAGR